MEQERFSHCDQKKTAAQHTSDGSVLIVDNSEYFDALESQEAEESDGDHPPQYKNVNEIESLDASLIATSQSSATPGTASNRKFVRFHRIEIREYGVTLGDHPSTRIGPPVTIEWQHQAELVVDLDQYERIFNSVGGNCA